MPTRKVCLTNDYYYTFTVENSKNHIQQIKL